MVRLFTDGEWELKWARMPILLLGVNQNFLCTPEGIPFRESEFPSCQRYLTKPLNLKKFLCILGSLKLATQGTLDTINKYVPKNLGQELVNHDLAPSKFENFQIDQVSEGEIRRNFDSLKVKVQVLPQLGVKEKVIEKKRKLLNQLKEKIIKERGDIWKEKKY